MLSRFLTLRHFLLGIALLALPVFAYLLWPSSDQTLSLLTKDYQETGTAVKQDFQSLPSLPLSEEESSFTLTDTTSDGIDIQFANETNSGSTPVDKKALNISFPKDYSKPIEVKLDDTRTITITDLSGKNDYSLSTLSAEKVETDLSTQEQGFFKRLLSLRSFAPKSEEKQSYLRYTSKDERKSLLYAYQKDQATGEKKLKHWTFYQEGNGVEQESYKIENSKVRINGEGVAEVFYYGEQNLKNDQAAAEVDSNLMERAQRTLEKELGEDILNGTSGKTPDFTIPKPYYVDKGGEKHEVEWKWSEEQKTLSVSFSPESYPVALDPTLSFAAPGQSNGGSVIGGEAASSAFGTAVTTGDFNADGKADLAVSAYTYSTNTGRVYIFYGDGAISVAAATADVVITGESTNNSFGTSLTAADLSNDGKQDLIVGAYQYSSNNTGRVYIFYNDGSIPTAAGSADIIITGAAANNAFGVSLTTGDFNANGAVDLAVGAIESGGTQQGKVHIFYNDGSIPTAAGSADVTITGEASDNSFGSGLVSGDFDADGDTDLVASATCYSGCGQTGRVYLFKNDGSIPTTAATADAIMTGASGNNRFGSSLAAGDFNFDGKVDLAVGANLVDKGYIFYNGSIITEAATGADITITGESGSYMGITAVAGDFNGDGRTDLAMGGGAYSSNTGRIYIFYNDGSIPTTGATADVIMTGETASSYFGYYSIAAGDLNSDGKVDLVVGAHGYVSSTGRAYIFYSQNGTVNTNQTITGGAAGDVFGSRLTTGDVNADGRTDLIVGAYSYNPGGAADTGRVYIFYGDGQIPSTAATADITITGNAAGDYFGTALATGDFNADGETDLAVGAQGYSSSTGRVYLFHNDGSIPTTAATADVTITGNATADEFGVALEVGDFNADGETDLAVGAQGYSSSTGRVYLFHNDGSIPTTAATADVTITGEASSNFGRALSAGDLNTDGEIDLVVGSYGYSSSTGRVYLFHNDGSIPTTAATADVTITGNATGDYFGYSLAMGDLNTDGHSDLVVGAFAYSSFAGRVYIFHNDGSIPTTAATADVTITGNAASDEFGVLLTVGDFNADGRIDLAVSADGYDAAAYTGQVSLFYNDGSLPTTAATADVRITGEEAGDLFGVFLTSGDMNGDGRTDLIVGAQGSTSYTGKVYIYETRENFAWKIQQQSGSGVPRTGLNTSGEEMSITGQATSNFGYALGSGDFNGDGKVDLAVGANIITSSTGRVYVFYSDGSLTTGAANADVIITGEATGNQFGVALGSGDMNSDGKTDLLVGALGYSSTTGRVYAFYNDGAYPSGAASADLFFTGEAANDRFGENFRTGDLDASGTTDLVVGSRSWTSATGRAYVFYNDGSMPTTGATADAIMAGETTSNSFGAGLTTGDFNADGKVDLAVGAWGWTTSTGRAYIFYNGSITTENASAADIIITGGTTNDLFGITMESGDFNADGKTDLVAAARNYASLLGRVYIFYNGSIITEGVSGADVTIGGESTGSYFGGSIKAADFNGDGRADIAVGANLTSSTTGRAFIFYNDGSWPATGASADIIFTGGEAASDAFGSSLAVGDFNADGEMDLAVGAYGYSSTAGKVYVYTFNDTVITGEATSTNFGYAMAAGDWNGDGRTDLAVGGYYYNDLQGRTFVFYSDSSFPSSASSADAIMTGEATFNSFGGSLVSADFNTDGKADLAVGAQGYSTNTGRAYIFYGGSLTTEGASGADVIIGGASTNDYFGASLSAADLNLNGTVDLVVSAITSGTDQGDVYVFYNDGSYPALASSADIDISSATVGGFFGTKLTVGDMDGTGTLDLIVGSTTLNAAHIFYNDGSIPTTVGTADVTISGETSSSLGGALTTGDFNADGRTDLAVGAYGYSSSTGRAYVFYGDGSIPTTAATADVTITGNATSDQFGAALSSGDFNFDGRTDLAVGAYGYTTNTGRAYIFYNDGSIPTTGATADVTMTGGATGNYFGHALVVGDLNADGKTDLIVGAFGYSSSTGRVYTFISEAAALDPISRPDMRTGGVVKFGGTVQVK